MSNAIRDCMTATPLICCTGRSPIPTRNGASAPSAPSPSSRAIPSEPVTLRQSGDAVSAVTARGGIVIRHHPRNACLGVRKHHQVRLESAHRAVPVRSRWRDGRTGRTDRDSAPIPTALRAEDRESILFDLGLGALHADFCVRIDDVDAGSAVAPARRPGGVRDGQSRDGTDPGANPHRVFISRLGRIEVYQPIPPPSGKKSRRGRTPMCCQSCLKKRPDPSGNRADPRTAGCPARIFIRRIRRATAGRGAAVRRGASSCISGDAGAFGDAEAYGIKRRVLDAVRAGEAPASIAASRHGRTSIRIALRQMKGRAMRRPRSTPGLRTSIRRLADRDDKAELHGMIDLKRINRFSTENNARQHFIP